MNRHENLSHQHLSDDQLIDALYGLRNVEREIGGCSDCAARWVQMRRVRTSISPSIEPAPDVLAAQRRRIYERIERPEPRLSRIPVWVPAFAAAAVLTIAGVVAYHPHSSVQSARHDTADTRATDTQLYSDVYSIEQSYEPVAAAPIHALFEPDGTAKDGTN